MITSCLTIATLAATLHVNESYTNSIHPGLQVECNDIKAGLYYNSINKVSVFTAYEFDFENDSSLELGVASGYFDYPVPMVKYNYKKFFAIPTKNGAVLGIQFNLGDKDG